MRTGTERGEEVKGTAISMSKREECKSPISALKKLGTKTINNISRQRISRKHYALTETCCSGSITDTCQFRIRYRWKQNVGRCKSIRILLLKILT